jgi:hypothetical protein
MLPVMHTAQITRDIKPSWEPLFELVGKELVPGFMWMFAVRLDDGAEVHAYKSIATRSYVHLAVDGRAFRTKGEHRYEEISASAAVAEAFDGWEDTLPQPKHPDAVRALLERHRSATSQEMH